MNTLPNDMIEGEEENSKYIVEPVDDQIEEPLDFKLPKTISINRFAFIFAIMLVLFFLLGYAYAYGIASNYANKVILDSKQQMGCLNLNEELVFNFTNTTGWLENG